LAAQDQALQTKYHTTTILQTKTNSNCRLCQDFDEAVDHPASECAVLATEQSIMEHDRECVQGIGVQ
jgi:hypothetical protein